MNYSIIIPIYNEERSLPSLLDKLEKIPNEIEVIIVDDGSNDQTDIILSNYNNFTIIHNKSNIGKGAAIKKGVESVSNQNIILMDGDLEIDIDNIPRLIRKFEQSNNDAILGIRWKANEKFLFEMMSKLKKGGVLSISLPTDPGLLWRLGRLFIRYFIIKKTYNVSNAEYEYINATEHINSIFTLVNLIRYNFKNQIEERFLPLRIKLLDINLFYIVHITKFSN